MRNVVIIGSGCAGNTAAIYTARASLNPLVAAGLEAGGQLSLTTEVENFPGFPEGIMGPELVANMRKQAERFGAEYMTGDITRADLSSRPFKLWAGRLLSAVSFVLVGCVVYWTGWDTNWKVFALALVGAACLSLLHLHRGDFSKLHARQSAWFWLFVSGLALVSYAGNYGHGLGLLHHGLDMIVVAAFSLAVFYIALVTRLDDAEAAALLAAPSIGDAQQ